MGIHILPPYGSGYSNNLILVVRWVSLDFSTGRNEKIVSFADTIILLTSLVLSLFFGMFVLRTVKSFSA